VFSALGDCGLICENPARHPVLSSECGAPAADCVKLPWQTTPHVGRIESPGGTMHLPLFVHPRERAVGAIALCCAAAALALPRVHAAAGDTPARVPAERAEIAEEIDAPRFKTPAPPFQDGHAEPTGAWQKAPRARAIHEVAELVAESAAAFDKGDMERGRLSARKAIERLEVAEKLARERGNASFASKLATERGRIHQRMLGDDGAAKGAYSDALIDDAGNKEAERALIELVEREIAAEREAARRSGKATSTDLQPSK
jgi:hypothetical protein